MGARGLYAMLATASLLCLSPAQAASQVGSVAGPGSLATAADPALTAGAGVEQKREAYVHARRAIKNGDENYARTLMATELKGYPLSVWLEYYLLSEHKSVDKFEDVQRFINSGKQHELASLLRDRYIEYYAALREFDKVHALIGHKPMSGPYESLSFKEKGQLCRFYEAAWQTGRGSDEAVAFANALYLDLNGAPRACTGLLAHFDSQGYLTDRLRLEKFERAYISRFKGDLTRRLADELSYTPYAAKVKAQMEFYEEPEEIFNYPLNTAADRRVAALAYSRWASFNPREAAQRLPTFIALSEPSDSELLTITKVIANRFLERGRSAEDVAWVDKHLPAVGWTPFIKEQRLRRAIWFAQWEVVYQLLDHVSADFAAQINWRYWKGRAALETGRSAEGRSILLAVAQDRSFFGFLAAQQLKLKPAYNQLSLSAAAQWPSGIHGDPAVARFFELYAMDDPNAIYEWREIARHSREETALLMAEWALRNGNTRYAIDSVVSAKRWDALSYRFPIVYPEIYRKNSQEQNVSLSFMYGVSRQESMLNPAVRSPVGAVGLMQLMPATAKLVSRRNKWDYRGSSSLTNPEINVRLGAAYLRDMLDRFGNNRILAAAAYNAGPGRIYRWESKDGLARDAAMYVENIPFAETRKYVQNVLLYDAIYNKLLTGQERVLLTDAELAFKY